MERWEVARWVREPSLPGRDAERKKRKISRAVFVLWWVCNCRFGLFDGLRWGPAPAASLTGLGSRATDQVRGGNSKRRTGGACRREGRLPLASPASLRVPWVGGCGSDSA